MARKTNEQLKFQSIQELEIYANSHPSEAGRISKILATSSAKMFKVSIRYNITMNLKPMEDIGVIQSAY